MQAIPLVHTTRGYLSNGAVGSADEGAVHVENVHLGSAVVVDIRGNILWQAGDPHYPVFTRSTLKPFQALPFMLDDGPARLGLDPAELALMCASHNAEDKHIAVVRGLLGKAGCDETHLQCGCHAPMFYEALGKTPPADGKWSQVHHNCSGKHAGFLAWCRLHDVSFADYVDPAHPLQQRIRSMLSDLTGLEQKDLPMGMDGCSAPNFAMPLSRLAWLYARLAQGSNDAKYGAAMGDLRDAMVARPDLVSGENRSDLYYMQAGGGDWVTKVGADGVQLIGIRSRGIGIAVKIVDGNNRAAQTATVSALSQLGLLQGEGRALLERYGRIPLINAAGRNVGDVEATYSLEKIA
ncbi:asparaginase [Noviherbaspirillum galbum]|uniref:Asparaginase n=1 Tax=Noviherbaspirillum galbum TaxID=2709383 RepID=A0A6B3SLT2_9BURK|nr:asparaginase [Noviherbaspirillum galbum]NEX59596.1 asparaginase [Noviherbaspirillum galbum]